MRHQDGDKTLAEVDSLNLFNGKHLEWLAWNWRAYNNQKVFGSRTQIVYGHFNRTVGLLPTPE